jgi:hypothetical protein
MAKHIWFAVFEFLPSVLAPEGVCALLRWLVLVGGNGQKVDRARLLEPIKVAHRELRLRVGERGLVKVSWSCCVSKNERKKMARGLGSLLMYREYRGRTGGERLEMKAT